MDKKLIRKMLTASGGPLFPWQLNTEWINNWKFRTTPAGRSKVLSGKGVETDKQYTERRKKETTKKTWRSDAADIAHGIGEGILALNPYTAIPYFGAKVGLDFLNGTYGWHTALNASVPLFHLAPVPASVGTVVDNALEDAANAGSKTARNLRVAREVKRLVSNNNSISLNNLSPIVRTREIKIGTREPEMRFNEETGEFEVVPISKLFEEKLKKVPPQYIRDSNIKYGEFSDLADIAHKGFIPKAAVDVGKFNRMYSEETINRLKDLGYNVKFPVPVLLKGFTTLRIPENYIRENTENPVYLGYYLDDNGVMGEFYHTYDKAIVDPTLANNLPSVMFHERNMHGTDALIQAYDDIGLPGAKNMYLDFIDKLFYKKKGSGDVQIVNPADKVSFTEDGKIIVDFNGTKRPISKGTDLWYEGRSTINELKRKYLLNTWRQYNKPKLLEDVRSQYIKDIDNMSENILLNDLQNTNGYGSTYVHLKDNNPNFIKDLKELLKSGAGYVTPIAGGYTLYNLLNNQNNNQLLEYRKQGGKMNILEFLKNGSRIHIKKENRGKFTDYCGGKVTSECIAKGKKSPNAAIRKRATFADNARHWKHENGGLFPSLKVKKHQAFVPGASITDSNPKAYKYLKKRKYSSGGFLKNVGDFLKSNPEMLDLGKSLFSGILDYKQTSSLLDGYLNKIAANANLQYEQALMNAEIERQKTPDVFTNTTGEVINQGVETIANGWLPFSLKVSAAKRKLDLLNAAVDLLIRDVKGLALGNMFGSFVLNGLGTLTSILG